MRCKAFMFFVISLSLWGCQTLDDSVGKATEKISFKKAENGTYVEIDPETGLVKPTSAATEEQKKAVSLSIGQPLSLDVNNAQACNKQVRERFLGRSFHEIPKNALPAVYRIIDDKTPVDDTADLGRVSFAVDENKIIKQAYCG